ncbi:tetratricopeptide repeat protein [SAR202 cluster bacterium AD-804-J14_MRT_500m]|nr:tetratricopeptide repeat protein [SAR202 cluster bacterium AD-804-J14_MRT_500m]
MRSSSILKDRYDLPLSTSSQLAADSYIEGLDLLLSNNYGGLDLLQSALDVDQEFSLAHAAMATSFMFRSEIAKAETSIALAKKFAKKVTSRELGHINAIHAFVKKPGPDAKDLIQEHVKEFPRDMLLVRIANRLFIMGCYGSGVHNAADAEFEWMKGLARSYGNDWAFLGMYAFSYNEKGFLDDALEIAQRSLDIYPRNSMASHAVAHVFFERGDSIGGLEFLDPWMVSYDKRAPFYVHLSWHQALFEMASGNVTRAHDLYRTALRPSVLGKEIEGLVDSASLLWRIQLYSGTPPPFNWSEVRDQALPAADVPGPAFRDAHAALAFAGSGDKDAYDRLVAGLHELSDQRSSNLTNDVTLPLVLGIGAFAEGHYAKAVDMMEPAYWQLVRLGGSNAQREVFEDTLIQAYIKAERFELAGDLLRRRLSRRASHRDENWLTSTTNPKD